MDLDEDANRISEYLENKKKSKSLGNNADPNEMFRNYIKKDLH